MRRLALRLHVLWRRDAIHKVRKRLWGQLRQRVGMGVGDGGRDLHGPQADMADLGVCVNRSGRGMGRG